PRPAGTLEASARRRRQWRDDPGRAAEHLFSPRHHLAADVQEPVSGRWRSTRYQSRGARLAVHDWSDVRLFSFGVLATVANATPRGTRPRLGRGPRPVEGVPTANPSRGTRGKSMIARDGG